MKKTKIALVNPPFIRSKDSSPQNNFKLDGKIFWPKYEHIPGMRKLWHVLKLAKNIRYGVRAGSRWPWTQPCFPVGALHYPFFMCYTASYLKENGVDVILIDAIADKEHSYQRFIDQVKGAKPDIVLIETSTPTIDIDLWVAEQVASFAEVCLAGPHVTNWDEPTLNKYAYVKYVLQGEYVLNCLEMARTKQAGIYKPVFVDDLDALPFPYRDFPAAIKYYDPSMPTEKPQLQMYASKGCPFKCVYCMWPQVMYNGVYVPRQPDKVAAEIIECKEKYGYKSIFFDDDTFNIGDERISQLCDKLKAIGLPWTMMGRIDTSPEWLFDKMVDSGCVGMRLGIETFDIGVLKNIKKGLQSDKIIKTLEHIGKNNPHLMIHVTMMKNLPGQTEEIHAKDMEILKNLGYSLTDKFRNYQLSSCVPFPGTELYKMLSNTTSIDLDRWNLYDGGQETLMKEINK